MKKSNADIPVTLVGAAVVIAFFLPFLDFGGVAVASGWDVVTAKFVPWSTQLVLVLLPVAGVALAVVGATGHRRARPLAFFFGMAVFGYLAYQLVRIFFAATGLGLWVTLAAAAAGLVLALRKRQGGSAETKV